MQLYNACNCNLIRALVKEKTKTLRPRASVYERKTIEHTVANLVVANALLALHAPVNAARMQTVVQLYKYRSHLEANAAAETVFFERVTKDVAAFLVNMSADSLKEALKPVLKEVSKRKPIGGLVVTMRRAIREFHAGQHPEVILHPTTGAPITAAMDDSL